MALNSNQLANILRDVLTKQYNIPTIDQQGEAAGSQPATGAPDMAVLQGFAAAIIDYFKANAEITIPNLSVTVSGNVGGTTSDGGSPSHSHAFGDSFSADGTINTGNVKGRIQ